MRKIVSIMKVGVLLLLFFALPAFGQSQMVTGTILDADKKIPLAGVTIKVKATNITTQTNEKGVFAIKATKGQTITISSIGFDNTHYANGRRSQSQYKRRIYRAESSNNRYTWYVCTQR